MIKAEPGHFVAYDPVAPSTKPSKAPVEAWADDGHPMVVGKDGLVRADHRSGYRGIDPNPDPDPAPYAFIPGDGWAVQYDDGAVPLVAWAMCTYGGGDGMYAMPVVAEDMVYREGGPVFTMGSAKGGPDGVKVVPISEAKGLRAP